MLSGLACGTFDSEGSALGFLLFQPGAEQSGGSGAAGVSQWQYQQRLTINASTLGETLTDVPVLVLLDSTRIDYNDFQSANGQDIRFFDSSGNRLEHQIQSWNSAGTSVLWVKVTEIVAGSADGFIYLVYGNANATDAQNAPAVWDNGFVSVLHLENGGGNNSTRSDTSGTVAAGTFVDTNGNSTPGIPGQIGLADRFQGDADHIDMGDQADFYLTTFTLSGWFRSTHTASIQPIMSRNTGNEDRNFFIGLWPTSAPGLAGRLYFRTGDTVALDVDLVQSTNLADGSWHYFSAVLDAGVRADLYYDDQAAVSQNSPGATAQPVTPLLLGGTLSGNYFFDGDLDEIRISNVARTAGWVAAQYLSQTDALLSFGTREAGIF